jgi:glycosyltransferase involved in cell wall biosynthesis
MVMPRGVEAWPTAEALWITAREWARAAERRFGEAWITTPDGSWRPADLPERSRQRQPGRSPRALPPTLRTLAKDLRLGARQTGFDAPVAGPWRTEEVRLVWEHHDLFNHAGRRLARAAGASLVRYVHAPQVWEARKWGVRRPLWGGLLERIERRNLRAADLVACVSAEVRDRLLAMGVPGERILISPMGVDVDRFSPAADGAAVRERHGIAPGEVVVGWCGSFRPFHGLDGLVEAFVRVARGDGGPGGAAGDAPPVRLLLVGDGALRPRLEETARESGVLDRVVFTGTVPHGEMPAHVRAMDLAVISSPGTGGFHYSPLKAREYAACGRSVVAPAEGEMTGLGAAGFVSLYRPGDAGDLARALEHLIGHPGLRREQGERARAFAVAHWTWEARLADALNTCRRLAEDGAERPEP